MSLACQWSIQRWAVLSHFWSTRHEGVGMLPVKGSLPARKNRGRVSHCLTSCVVLCVYESGTITAILSPAQGWRDSWHRRADDDVTDPLKQPDVLLLILTQTTFLLSFSINVTLNFYQVLITYIFKYFNAFIVFSGTISKLWTLLLN